MEEENEKLQQYVEDLNEKLTKGVSKAQNNIILVEMAHMMTNFIPQMIELKKSVFAFTTEILELKQEITELKNTNDTLNKKVLSFELEKVKSVDTSKNLMPVSNHLDIVTNSNKRKGSIIEQVPNVSKVQKIEEFVLPHLPKEIWCKIFSNLCKKSIKDATGTCRYWFEIIRGDSKLSGNFSVAWQNIQNTKWIFNNWPALKTIEITDTLFTKSTEALNAVKRMGFEKCKNLEKVVLAVNFDVAALSMTKKTSKLALTKRTIKRNIQEGVAMVKSLAFDPKVELDSFKIEHLDSLNINPNEKHLKPGSPDRSGFIE